MENIQSSTEAYSAINLHQLKWSPAEKSVARKVFDEALQRELADVMHEAKRRALGIAAPSELWELEEYLRESRKKINDKYDYRYSNLLDVFGWLLREERISIDELRGLDDEKVAYIRMLAGFWEKQGVSKEE
jgi:Photoprotection regulator fluorescence recovery protein